jgi:hypothetical protein
MDQERKNRLDQLQFTCDARSSNATAYSCNVHQELWDSSVESDPWTMERAALRVLLTKKSNSSVLQNAK